MRILVQPSLSIQHMWLLYWIITWLPNYTTPFAPLLYSGVLVVCWLSGLSLLPLCSFLSVFFVILVEKSWFHCYSFVNLGLSWPLFSCIILHNLIVSSSSICSLLFSSAFTCCAYTFCASASSVLFLSMHSLTEFSVECCTINVFSL